MTRSSISYHTGQQRPHNAAKLQRLNIHCAMLDSQAFAMGGTTQSERDEFNHHRRGVLDYLARERLAYAGPLEAIANDSPEIVKAFASHHLKALRPLIAAMAESRARVDAFSAKASELSKQSADLRAFIRSAEKWIEGGQA